VQDFNNSISIILPTLNEIRSISNLINSLLKLSIQYNVEMIVVDDDSSDGTGNLIREFSQKDKRIRLIYRIGRKGLSSAIKEGCLSASGEIIVIMDTDGQHDVKDISKAIDKLIKDKKDLISGSRFLEKSCINGLSMMRERGSSIANNLARFSLSGKYKHLTDYMTGFIVFRRNKIMPYVQKVDVNGFKFLYELLAVSKNKLNCDETPLNFKERKYGSSKLDISILWEFLISLVHTSIGRIIPRRAISFGLVGSTGVLIQLLITYSSIWFFNIDFENALPAAVVIAATSNYLINNFLTFRISRLKNRALIIGLIKFLIVSSLPIIANVGLATSFYKNISPNTLLSQLAGIFVVFIWNYAASSKFVWNN